MIPEQHLLILASFAAGVAWILYIRRFDMHEPEPFARMLVVTVWGGAWSIVMALALYRLVYGLGFSPISPGWWAMLVIGPVEEAAKLAALVSSYLFIRKQLNEPTDGMIYMASVALGFSMIENYMYARYAPNTTEIMLTRLLICTPTHIFDSVFMGLAFYVVARKRKGLWLLVGSFLYASLIHGLYDMVIFTDLGGIAWGLVIYISYYMAFTLLEYVTAVSPFRKSLKAFIETYDLPATGEGIDCLNCGSDGKKTTYRLGGHRIQKCDNCECYVTTKAGIKAMFRFFGSMFMWRPGGYHCSKRTGLPYSTLCEGNRISDAEGTAFFRLDELDAVLEEINTARIAEVQNRWWFPAKLK